MLKLLKYDFRRNRDLVLAVFVVTILLQIGIAVSKVAREGGLITEVELLALHSLTYITEGVVLLFYAVRTYSYNLKSYNRRLLPVKTLYMVLSPLLLCWALLLGIAVMAGIHLGIYTMMNSTSFLPEHFGAIAFYSLLQLFWSAGFALLTIIFSITVARSIRFRGRVWIGIAVFFVVQNGISFIEQWLFDSYFSVLEHALSFEVLKAGDAPSGGRVLQQYFLIWPTLFEAAISILLVYVMVKLIERRVEI